MDSAPESSFATAYQYQPGGSLPSEAPTYVVRQADRDLYSALRAKQYCYILNARQMGKSSLRIRTMSKLRQEGIACTDIELSGIGSQQITATQWYGGIIQELVSGFDLSFQRRPWMQEREDLSPVQRLAQFIETVLLVQITTPIVIFIDEIDSVLGLSFPTDEFFALIRNCYDRRGKNPNYQRLTFAILGVATPSDLIRDKQYSTPFNIGQSIALRGFKFEDCGPLMQGVTNLVSHPAVVMQEILRWTGGQPFLTQKLCWLVREHFQQEPPSLSPWAKRLEDDTDSDDVTDDAAIATSRQPASSYNPNAPAATPSLIKAMVNAKILKPNDLTGAAASNSYARELERGLLSPNDPGSAKRTRALVRNIVRNQVLKNWEAQDEPEHLRTIRDRLIRTGGSSGRILQLYQWILQEGSIPAKTTHEYLQLRLSGAVDVYQGQLRVKNPIYAKIFNLSWVEKELTALRSRFMAEPMTAAIVYTDIESLTAKMAEDERHVLQLIQRDFAVMQRYCQQYEGTLLKTLGDSLLMSFETADKAVRCAIAIQKALSNAAAHRPERDILRHRIGIHIGDIFLDGQDVMGNGVNIAGILQERARAGGICLSQEAYDAVSRHLIAATIDMGEHEIRGLPNAIRLYQIPPERPNDHKSQQWRQAWPTALLAGIVASGLVLGVRATGFLQPWEFRAFDQFMRARPAERPDDRLFLVTLTDEELTAPLATAETTAMTEEALAALLQKLNQGQPQVIGLDLSRNRGMNLQASPLAQSLVNNDRVVAVCGTAQPGAADLPTIPSEQKGFSMFRIDTDGVLRRQLLATNTAAFCQNHHSFEWNLATRYLAAFGIQAIATDAHSQVGDVRLPSLQPNTAGYYGLDTTNPQILLNYRATPRIAATATLSEVLAAGFDPATVRGRIVLIGTASENGSETGWRTPYSGGWKYRQQLSTLEMQAHMTSQLVSAVLDNRPFIWSWSEPLEMLWISCWTLLASFIAMQLRSRRWISIYLGGMMTLLVIICWAGMGWGGWIPFIPTVLGIFMAGVIVHTYRSLTAQRLTRRLENR